MKEMLREFWKKNNRAKPEHILFYRDGVSNGQFQEVRGNLASLYIHCTWHTAGIAVWCIAFSNNCICQISL